VSSAPRYRLRPLGDLHLNTWLHEARSRNPIPSILFVDWWKGHFLDHRFEIDRKGIEMFHALKIHIGDRYGGTKVGTAWTVSKDGTAAVWDKGFQAFLNSPADLQQVLEQLQFVRSTVFGGGQRTFLGTARRFPSAQIASRSTRRPRPRTAYRRGCRLSALLP
jgi:hypothetical protein